MKSGCLFLKLVNNYTQNKKKVKRNCTGVKVENVSRV